MPTLWVCRHLQPARLHHKRLLSPLSSLRKGRPFHGLLSVYFKCNHYWVTVEKFGLQGLRRMTFCIPRFYFWDLQHFCEAFKKAEAVEASGFGHVQKCSGRAHPCTLVAMLGFGSITQHGREAQSSSVHESMIKSFRVKHLVLYACMRDMSS